jgi:hypothetical protein
MTSIAIETSKMISKAHKDEAMIEAFGDVFCKEFTSDEEPYHKKYRRLLSHYENGEMTDDVFMTLTGWSIETLLKRARKKVKRRKGNKE